MAGLPEFLPAGRVGRPHGLDGSFHVTRPRPGLLRAGLTVRVGDASAVVARVGGTDSRPVVRLDGTSSREAVEALRGADLRVARADAPPLEDGAFYPEQLEGLAVRDGRAPVGIVSRMLELPSCEVLEVRRPDGSDLLVPMVSDAIRRIDVDANLVDVDLAFLGEA